MKKEKDIRGFSYENILKAAKAKIIDPFDPYGQGIVSFFTLIRTLGVFLILASLLFIPNFIFFDSGQTKNNFQRFATANVLGNLGETHP